MSRFARSTISTFRASIDSAVARRAELIRSKNAEAFRVFSGQADGIDGVFIDVYGPGATLIVYEGQAPASFDGETESHVALESLRPLGVRAVYLKPFVKDRSRLGGELPPIVTRAEPSAGEILLESVLIREHDWTLEVRLFDGLSTGLFLDQRDNRAWACDHVKNLVKKSRTKPAVLNTFAYTCAFSVAAAVGGAETTSVDVSGRYLDWGKRNFTHNGLDPAVHRFAKMDTFEFMTYAARKGLTYDLIVLDPPSFGSGSKKRGIRAWSAESDYAKLVSESAKLLRPRGVIFASTNTSVLCRPGQLEREITKAVGRPHWIDLPPVPVDFSRETDRFTAMAFRRT